MNISFHGIRNIAACNKTQNICAASSEKDKYISTGSSYVSFEVDNNKTNDLDKAQKIFTRYHSPGSNTVIFEVKPNKEAFEDDFFINGQKVEFNDDNLKVFETISRFLKTIAEKKPEDFETDDSFERQLDINKQRLEKEAKELYGDENIKVVKMTDPYWVKESAAKTMETVQNAAFSYFA